MRYGYFATAGQLLAGFAVAAVMTACGGGDSSSGAPITPVPTPNGAPVARIADLGQSYAGLPVTLDARTSTDPENDPLSFEWRLVNAPTGSVAKLTNPTQAVANLKPDVAGTYDLLLRVSDSKAAVAELPVRVTAGATPTITTNMPEPVTGQVQLVLSGTVPGTIAWSVDQASLGTTTGTAVANWPSALTANGEHVVLARIIQTDGSTLDIQRRIVSMNSVTGLGMAFKTRQGANAFNLSVSVTSPLESGVKQVQVTLGGKDLGTVSAVTSCSSMSGPCDFNRYYAFPIPPSMLASGRYSGQVSATDILGTVTRWNIDVDVVQTPQIANLTPANGTFVRSSDLLNISGTVASDPGNTVNSSVSIDGREIYSTTFSSGADQQVSTQYNLGQLVKGIHNVQMYVAFTTGGANQARSAEIAVLPPGEMPMTPLPGIILTTYGTSDYESLLAVDDVSALVGRSETGKDATYREVLLEGGSSTAGPDKLYAGNVLGIGNRRVYVLENEASRCGDLRPCVSEWSAAEGWRNVSGTTYPVSTQAAKFSAGQVAWVSSGRLVVFDGSQRKYSAIELPKTDKTLTVVAFTAKAGIGYAVVRVGDEALYLARSDQPAISMLYSRPGWTVENAVTDGNHVGWNVRGSGEDQILARAWSDNAAQPALITSYGSQPIGISNGNFVWLDVAGIRTTSLTSSRPIIRLTEYGKLAVPTATGVIYESADTLLAWNASTGVFQTLLGTYKSQDPYSSDVLRMRSFITDKALVFQFGGYLYRIVKP